MSDFPATPAMEPTPAKAPAAPAKAPATPAKAPARPAAEIRADLARERAALTTSFDTLRAELDEAVDAGRQRIEDAGRKARVIGPIVAGVAVVAAAALLFRPRSRRKE